MTSDQVQELLRMVNLQGTIRSGNVVLPCPFAAVSGHTKMRDTHPSLGILTDDEGAVWNCFSCGRHGEFHSFFDRLRDETGVMVEEALTRLDKMLEKDPMEIVAGIPTYDRLFIDPKAEYPVFPESWLGPYAGKVPKYIIDRGVTIDTVKTWELGYDRKAFRVFFPVRDAERRLVGAVGRLTREMDFQPKSKNYWHKMHGVPSCGWPLDHKDGKYRCSNCGGREVEDRYVSEGFRKSLFCYGEHLFPKGHTAVIVEGAIDTLKVYQALQGTKYFPLGLLGAKVTREQIDKIVKLTSNKVVSFLDNDPAGRDGAGSLKHFIGSRVRFFKVTYPAASDLFDDPEMTDEKLDPGVLPQETIRKMIENARVVFG